MKRLINLVNVVKQGRPPVGTTPTVCVHRENKWQLLRYVPSGATITHKTPVLLVPSLINRHYILDLMPGKSFAEHLAYLGHDVYIIDWGTPGPEDRFLDFDTICDAYIGRSVRKCALTAGSNTVHLLGYCLGGTLAAIYTARRPEQVASLMLLAAPIRFGDTGLLSVWTKTPTFDVQQLTKAFGNIPWPLMQFSFHMLRPTLTLSKLVTVADRAWNDEFLNGFVAMETWGNDNVSLPGAFYSKYIEELYRNDALATGTLGISGRPVQLHNIRCPLLAVTFEHDNIVPKESAAAIFDLVGSKEKHSIHLPGGHVGGVVSSKAKKTLWPQLSNFWVGVDNTPQRVVGKNKPHKNQTGPKTEPRPAD